MKGEEKERLKIGMKLLKTGMSKQIIQFDSTNHKHKENYLNNLEPTIGRHESYLELDLVVLMLLKIVEPKLFIKHNLFQNKICRDNRMLITKSK